MTATDDDNRASAGGRDVVGQLRSAGALDGLFEQIDSGQVSMTGTDGLLPALHQGRPWRGAWPLGLSEHLGYDRGEPTSQARGNARNGTTSKTVDSSGWGPSRSGCPGTGPGPSPRARVAPRASAVWTASMRVNHQA